MSYFRKWRCLAYVRILDPNKRKFASRTNEFVFIEYGVNSKTYRLYDLVNKVIIKSNCVDFSKSKFLYILRNSGGLEF